MQIRLFRAFVLVAAAFLCWSAPSFAQDAARPILAANEPAPLQQSVVANTYDNTGYVLDTGDKIHLTVFGKDNETLGGEFEVDGNGLVRLPLIGPTKAGGLRARGLEDAITQALAAGDLIDPRV